jgi:hypothetical protein
MSISDDFGDFLNDISDVPGDLVKAGASLFEDGVGNLAGIAVSGSQIYVFGAGALVPAIVSGYFVSKGVNALIKQRHMSAEERTLAELVFGSSLPANDQIFLTNLIGLGNHAFTMPNPVGQYLINLGDDYDDPLRATTHPENGQLLIHELTHVWQIHYSTFVPGLICDGVANQVQDRLWSDVYSPPADGRDWSGYNIEQQASIVDAWYGGYMLVDKTYKRQEEGACSRQHPFYRYLLVINHGSEPPVVQTLSLRNITRSKFGINNGFSVKSQYPLNRTGSLRKTLIGLKN